MVVALIALFVSASGVTWAASKLPADSVKSKQILNGSVKNKDLAPDSVTGDNVVDESLSSSDLGFDSVTADQLADESVDTPSIQFDAVGADQIGSDAVGTDEIAFDAVGSDEVADGSLQKIDLGEQSVGADQIGNQLVNVPAEAPTQVLGGTAGNGSYRVGQSTATCNEGQLITGFAQWDPDDAADLDYQLTTVEVVLDQDAESVTVQGGNDSGVDHDLSAVAVCLLP